MTETHWKEVETSSHTTFRVPTQLEFLRELGRGAYGVVCSFQDLRTGHKLAVKKIPRAFTNVLDGKRILRELKILLSLRHSNVLGICDVYPPDRLDFDDVYIVTELMDTDLHRIIHSKIALGDEHHKCFAYQILKGLLYIHSANVIHRDLKPSNILVNKACDLRICDFGLARGLAEEDSASLTDYVVTRWYRAPEVVLLASEYTKAIDIWSVGCILCELKGRAPIFPGTSFLDLISKIIAIIGSPGEEDLEWLPPKSPARCFFDKVPQHLKRPWSEIYPNATVSSLDAIEKMLTFAPGKRVSARGALALPYFSELPAPEEDDVADAPIDWSFDNFQPTKPLLRRLIYQESLRFHPGASELGTSLTSRHNCTALRCHTAQPEPEMSPTAGADVLVRGSASGWPPLSASCSLVGKAPAAWFEDVVVSLQEGAPRRQPGVVQLCTTAEFEAVPASTTQRMWAVASLSWASPVAEGKRQLGADVVCVAQGACAPTSSNRAGVMAISIVPFIGLICFTTQYLYPAYESVATMLQREPTHVDLTQWTLYWVICVVFAAIEHNFLFLLVDYLPLYLEMKSLGFLWLVHPQYLGAAWIWYGKLKALYEAHGKDIHDMTMKALGPLSRAKED